MWGEMYADQNTYSGPDENPMVDANDEIVFMARHLGEKRDPKAALPAGVVANVIIYFRYELTEFRQFTFLSS